MLSPYLLQVRNRKHRRAMTKLRLSDHSLEIEKVRHDKPRINRENRKCKLCTESVIEDEIHFLLEYRKFDTERLLLLTSLNHMNFDTNRDSLFKNLMKYDSKEINNKLAKFIYDGFEKRLAYLNNLDNSDKTVLLSRCLNLIRNKTI